MNWSKDTSVRLSRICVAAFALGLLALDIGAYPVAAWYTAHRLYRLQHGALLTVSIYLGSLFAWICLYHLWRLLGSIRDGEVFVDGNVRRLRIVSWCCIGAGAICLLSAAYYLPFIFIAAAAGFLALIVHIVKNAFRHAVLMKDELDLTV
ncbi:MAG: DUF2975 domain-containing protein [Oscillospiraceae bacterium]|nr:DUF2975 domain-containing protein [Oscillospiraceae bacterium]